MRDIGISILECQQGLLRDPIDRDAVRRAKAFRELLKKGRAYTGKPEVRRVKIVYSDNQDWGLENGGLKIRTHGVG
jgi:hypothetical protein